MEEGRLDRLISSMFWYKKSINSLERERLEEEMKHMRAKTEEEEHDTRDRINDLEDLMQYYRNKADDVSRLLELEKERIRRERVIVGE